MVKVSSGVKFGTLKIFGVMLVTFILVTACGEGSSDVDQADEPRNTSTPTATEVVEEATETEVESENEEMQQWSEAPEMQLEDGVDYRARINTNMGSIVIDLHQDDAPTTVNNFVFLANEGFYTNVPVHRIVPGFVIQSGDPTGTGTGGPGYRFDDEQVVGDYVKGAVAMANAGPNTNGSQFFITLDDLSGRLPKAYTIFGQVVEGESTVDEIASVPVEQSASGERSKPTEEVTIENVEIIEE